MKKYFIIVLLLASTGCSGIDKAINEYNIVAHKINLGDSKEKVLSILVPTQGSLSVREIKQPERYTKNGVKVDIYYFRTLRQPDGLTTDDEFTPYVFNDDKLVGIGWTVLGGPNTKGQVVPQTNVNVQQSTVVY